jgi:hypothetical protein
MERAFIVWSNWNFSLSQALVLEYVPPMKKGIARGV